MKGEGGSLSMVSSFPEDEQNRCKELKKIDTLTKTVMH